MNYSDVLLNLINFELIAAVSDWSVVLFISMHFVLLGWVVEKFIPVELLVISWDVFAISDGFLLSYTQFNADPFYEFWGWNFFSCEKIPHKGNLTDDHFYVTVSDGSIFLVIEVVKTELNLFLEGTIVDFV